MAKKHMKKCSNIPGHKGNANQTMLRFYLTPFRMATVKNSNTPVRIAIIKNTTNNMCW
jgi:hypothetical protein